MPNLKSEVAESEDYSSRKHESSRSSSNQLHYERNSRKYENRSTSSTSRSRSRSSSSDRDRDYKRRRRYYGTREHPYESSVLGVFGLRSFINCSDLYKLFSYYGKIEDIHIIYDKKTQYSRGFAFVYFRKREDASYARRKCNGMQFFGRRIRVDYSITRRAHTPTPGIYMGFRSRSRNSSSNRR
ncbi:hypothetical protein PVAND_009499 [Polypedilum vanderplanki]|uniref:RRM domain-containing protein n=1 Tax=Polypedilum vanderplanki TaxID=319348 RepID=A0A9J6CCX9_POLVA|nr:hypothetical protein PVAND_009499 [Polypedilum vanderplanki]